MYRISKISKYSFSKENYKFEEDEQKFLRVYSFDRYGGDYTVEIEDLDTNGVVTLSSNSNIFEFVDKNFENIIGCLKDDNNSTRSIPLDSYSLCVFTKTDMKLSKMIEFEETIRKSKSLLANETCVVSISDIFCPFYGTIFELMLRAFHNQRFNGDLFEYHYSGTDFYELRQFYIVDDYLYILVDNNTVNVYKILNKNKFHGVFAKRVMLTSKQDLNDMEKRMRDNIPIMRG